MRTINPDDRHKVDFTRIAVMILLAIGIGYYIYSTAQYFKAMKQVNEANDMIHNTHSLFGWAMYQYKKDVLKACNFDNIQRAPESENFQNMNRFLELNTDLKVDGKYVERILLTPDQQGCTVTAYLKNNQSMGKDVAGKYISSRYDVKTGKRNCTTNIQKRRLVKGCHRI